MIDYILIGSLLCAIMSVLGFIFFWSYSEEFLQNKHALVVGGVIGTFFALSIGLFTESLFYNRIIMALGYVEILEVIDNAKGDVREQAEQKLSENNALFILKQAEILKNIYEAEKEKQLKKIEEGK